MLFSKPAMMKVSVPTTNVAMVSGMSNFTDLDVGVVFIFLPYHLCGIWSIVFNCHRMFIVIFVTYPVKGKLGWDTMRLLIDHVKWRGRFAGHCQILARSVSDVGIATVMNASFEGLSVWHG